MNPITTVAPVSPDHEATHKRAAENANQHAGSVTQGQTEQATPGPQAVRGASDYEQGTQDRQETTNQRAQERTDTQQQSAFAGEKRDFGLEDGKVLVRVYSNDGKLLRETPPGYLPLNKPRVNVTA